MEENGYPDFEAHRKQHEKMIAQVEDFLARYERDREGTVQDMTDFLKDWLIHHIAGTRLPEGKRGAVTTTGFSGRCPTRGRPRT